MKKTIFFYTQLLVMVFFNAGPIYTQENIITSVDIIGLRRTRPHIAMLPLERFIGMERSAFDPDEVFAVVQDMRVLNPISAELVETTDGLTLQVTVEERWSIFPFPMVMADSGGFNAGLFLMDTNAFGMRDMLALGGAYGTYGWTAMAMYNHNPRRDELPGWNTMFMYGHQDREDVDRNESVYRSYATNQLRFSLGLNYLFMDLLTGSINFSFSDISLNNDDNAINSPEHGARLLGINPSLSMRQSSWDGVFLSQQSISLGYSYNHAITGSSYHQIDFRGSYDHSFVPGFRLNIRSSGVWKSTSDPLFEDGPQRAQVSILPRNFSARHYAGFTTGLEKHLLITRWGTLSVQGSWQGVFSYGPISDFEFNHGPAGGINFYLSRVALPALGIGIAYNMNTGLYQTSFSMGMSF